ncbi:MAG: DUF4197 domain-containing protein [Candidatus Cloacimonetes bacterium]|nr:DUF4197 domain-containing protein [Candidatus Cloacimonadota bacterium]MDY0173403.1 DUF4197 domain-containing protein [Candidatus Cloacimonadaceae bacterium]
MKKVLLSLILSVCLMMPVAHGADIRDFLKAVPVPSVAGSSQDSNTIASGLKEALSVGTTNAVGLLSKKDGYFGNEAVKILLPENIRKVGDVLRMAGYQKEVDAFIFSMNRAAEKAVPKAANIFAGAIKEMSFDDAKKILSGGDTAATNFFKEKTSSKLSAAFKPEISQSMNEVGVTKAYKDMLGRYTSLIPFGKVESLDLDTYVTNKSLDGLFYQLGREEANIRTNPAARTTDLLKKVFRK